MSKIILLISLIVNLWNSECTKGCLSCTTEDTCLLCDITNNYILSEGSCTQIERANCKKYDFGGRCLKCDNEYYLSEDSGVCELVQKNK